MGCLVPGPLAKTLSREKGGYGERIGAGARGRMKRKRLGHRDLAGAGDVDGDLAGE